MIGIVCSSDAYECQNSRFPVKEGDVFVVPRFHPMAHLSFNNDSLVFVGFSSMARRNRPQFLAGSRSVLQTMDLAILAISFNLTNATMKHLLAPQQEYVFLECTSCAEEEEKRMQEEERQKKEEEEKKRKEEEKKRGGGGQEEERGRGGGGQEEERGRGGGGQEEEGGRGGGQEEERGRGGGGQEEERRRGGRCPEEDGRRGGSQEEERRRGGRCPEEDGTSWAVAVKKR